MEMGHGEDGDLRVLALRKDLGLGEYDRFGGFWYCHCEVRRDTHKFLMSQGFDLE